VTAGSNAPWPEVAPGTAACSPHGDGITYRLVAGACDDGRYPDDARCSTGVVERATRCADGTAATDEERPDPVDVDGGELAMPVDACARTELKYDRTLGARPASLQLAAAIARAAVSAGFFSIFNVGEVTRLAVSAVSSSPVSVLVAEAEAAGATRISFADESLPSAENHCARLLADGETGVVLVATAFATGMTVVGGGD
jgi:hypothetical protein